MAVTGTTFSSKGGTANTTELRALGSTFSAAVASAGMVKTADTGQIDWTTVAWAGGVNTWGYEVWRFADALQATKSVFVRLSYSQTSTTPTALTISAQVGTASDGSGNLTSAPNTNTSVTSAVDICKSGSTPVNTVKPWYVYGDGSSLIIASAPELMTGTSIGYGGLFLLERARHTDGTPLGDGVAILWAAGSATTITIQSLLIHNLTPQLGSAAGIGWVPIQQTALTPTSGVLGTNMYVLPYFTGFTPGLGAPSKMVVGIIKADMPTGNTFPLTHYGEAGTFVAISQSAAYVFGIGNSVNTLLGLGIRVA